jgi:hypothetical protein
VTLYVQPVLLALRTWTRQRAGVGVAVGGTGVEVAVEVGVAVEETGVGVFVFVADGVEVGVGVDVISGTTVGEVEEFSDHIAKSFAMQPWPVSYQPSLLNDTAMLCVPSAIGTK